MRKIISILLLFVFSTPLVALTRGEIRSEVRERLKDAGPTADEYYWSDTELNRKINTIQYQISAQARLLYGSSYTYTVTDQREYNKPDKCLAIEKVSFWISSSTSNFRRLEYKSVDDLDAENPNWQAASSGKPLYYYEEARVIGLSPPASVSYSTTGVSLCFEFIKIPDEMDEDSDVPFDTCYELTPYHELIIVGVVNTCRGQDPAILYTLVEKMKTELSIRPDRMFNKRLYPR